MQFYKILGLEKEPFSTSPDPAFMFLSREHEAAQTNILIQLHLRRGLNVILGDVGTGKTTLSRKLVQELGQRERFIFHIMLNPAFRTEKEFLMSLIRNFQVPHAPGPRAAIGEMRDVLEKYLLHKTSAEDKIITVMVDEAQKLSLSAMESLRVLLNYETNEHKLIQIVLFGQLELHSKLMELENFYDRIDYKFTLNPLGPEEVRSLIEFRLRQAGYGGEDPLFDEAAVRTIHQYTKGYPRKIIRVCHNCLRELVVSKTGTVVDKETADKVIAKDSASRWQKITVPQNSNS